MSGCLTELFKLEVECLLLDVVSEAEGRMDGDDGWGI